MEKNYLEDRNDTLSNLPDANEYRHDTYTKKTKSGHVFNFKKCTVDKPNGWVQVPSSNSEKETSEK